jgi:small subunit ribosomal protein S6
VKTYEALLLVEPTIAAKEWPRIGEEVDRIIKRHGGAVLQVTRFGERKLAFPVKKNNRGTYVLTYFSAPPKVLGKVKADMQLSEVILRSILLAHDGELRKEPPKDFETAGPVPPKIDGFRGPGGPGGPGGGRPWEDRGPRPPVPSMPGM